jgi:glycosyltransferase involved in cell wall biosynthesis
MRRFSHLVFLSKQVDCNRFFDHLVARLSRHPGIAVIPNCADPERFDQPQPDFRKEFGISTGTLFLCVANFSIGKNQALALRAFRKARLAGATLVFIGSEFNDYQALLNGLDRELTELYPDGRVLFLEKLSRDQTMAAFQACDVFVLTSKSECQPIVLIEAMACHKPFISTESSGCIAELVGGVIANSEQEIGAQMKSLHENPDIRRSLGHKGWEAFQDRYTCNRALDAFEGLLC